MGKLQFNTLGLMNFLKAVLGTNVSPMGVLRLASKSETVVKESIS